jgi:uncharacterized cofD-like protein
MNIVAMGGGTGLSTLLHGLKKYVHEEWSDREMTPGKGLVAPDAIKKLSAVVTVSDNGGSSGRLRRAFRVLPPGDIRNCLVALSEDEALLSRLFQFRFASGRGLKGHSFGNLFLTALTGVMGDFQEAVKVSGEVLATRGSIFPSTTSDVNLEAVLDDGRVVTGETQVSRARSRIARIRLVPSQCRPLPQTLEALEEADVITLGPGSLFTSLIPNLLVRGIAKRVAGSRAARIYICNLMTQPGETTAYSAADHVRTIYEHCGFPIFDYVLVNTQQVSAVVRKRYLNQKSRPVAVDVAEMEKLGVRVISADLVSEERAERSTIKKVRHHSQRLARAVMDIGAHHRPEPDTLETSERELADVAK